MNQIEKTPDFVPAGKVDRKTDLKGTARKYFLKHFDLLVEAGTLSKNDVELLTIAATTFSDIEHFTNLIEKEKTNVEPDFKMSVELAKLKTQSCRTFLGYTQKLGIGAYDRGKIRATPKQEKEKSFLSSVK